MSIRFRRSLLAAVVVPFGRPPRSGSVGSLIGAADSFGVLMESSFGARVKLSSSSVSSSLNQPRLGVSLSSSSFSGEGSAESLVRFAIVELIVRGDTSEVSELFGIT